MKGKTDFVEVKGTREWVISYFADLPLMATFQRRPVNHAAVPPLVSEWHCTICGDEGELDCGHIELLRELAPVAVPAHATKGIDDRREAHYQAGRYPPYPIT